LFVVGVGTESKQDGPLHDSYADRFGPWVGALEHSDVGPKTLALRACDTHCEVVATDRRRRRAAMIAAAGLAVGVTVAIGALVIAFVVMANRPAVRVESSPTTGSTTTTAPRATVSPRVAAMREWKSRASEHFRESAVALQQVSDAADVGNIAALRGACQLLHDTNSVGLQTDLPSPDASLTAEIQRMIDDINVAAHACLRFAGSENPDDVSTYQKYLSRAMDHLNMAKTIMDRDLAGR
jgi:hypothetical protein